MEIGEILFILSELAPTISTGQEEGPIFGSGIDDFQLSFHPPGNNQAFVGPIFSTTADFLAAFPFERNDRSFHKGIGSEQSFELLAMLSIEVQKNLTMNGLAIHSDIH